MTLYLSFNQLPELANRSEAERAVAVKQVSSLAMKNWEWWAALLVAGALTGVGAWLGGAGISGALGAGVGAALGGSIHHLAVIHIAHKHYSAVLAGKQ